MKLISDKSINELSDTKCHPYPNKCIGFGQEVDFVSTNGSDWTGIGFKIWSIDKV